MLISNSICSGIEINLEQKRFRKIYSFLGFVFGEWESLPKTEYIGVYKTRTILKSASAHWPKLSNNSYVVNSFWENRRPVTLHKASSNKEALAVARDVANALGIKILDSTETAQKWI